MENCTNTEVIEETRLPESILAQIDLPAGSSDLQMRELLSAVCNRIIGLARKHRAGVIVLEKGFGKAAQSRQEPRAHSHDQLLARTVLLYMLPRKARLAGIKVIEAWSAYSTSIGNLEFEVPDACASAAEIGRRGIAREAGIQVGLPAMAIEVASRLWKDEKLPIEVHTALRRSPSWASSIRALNGEAWRSSSAS